MHRAKGIGHGVILNSEVLTHMKNSFNKRIRGNKNKK